MNLDEVKRIFSSVPGRRLINCLLLVQPITPQELKQFVKLSLEVFNPNGTWKKPFPDVSMIELDAVNPELGDLIQKGLINAESMPEDLFTNTDLYSKDRILQKALKCGMIIEKKASSTGKGNSYYFLNSDLYFTFDYDGLKLRCSSKSKLKGFSHERVIDTKKRPFKVEKIPERLAIPLKPHELYEQHHFFPIGGFLRFFWWLHNHWPLILKTLQKYHEISVNAKNPGVFTRRDLPKEWRNSSHLISKALDDHIFVEKQFNLDFLFLIDALANGGVYIWFNRTYEILRCFSNFEDHLSEMQKKSPMELLEILSSEKYEINPERRRLLFTSILIYHVLGERVTENNKKIIKPFIVLELNSNDKIAASTLGVDSEIKRYCSELRKSPLFLKDWYPDLY